MHTKTKTTMMVMAAALLCGIGNVCALPLRILVEEQHAKIEPAIKKFQFMNVRMPFDNELNLANESY